MTTHLTNPRKQSDTRDCQPYASALTACRGTVGANAGNANDNGGGGGVFGAGGGGGEGEGGGGGGLSSLKQSMEAREALDVFESAPGSASGTTAVRNAAIALYAAVGSTDRAFALYEEMRTDAAAATSTEAAATSTAAAATSTLAVTTSTVVDATSPVVADTSTATSASTITSSAASSSRAAAGQRSHQAPDTITYNTLIAACVASNQLHRARQLHRDMVAADVPRSARTYVSLMVGLDTTFHNVILQSKYRSIDDSQFVQSDTRE
jgi:pentatricopeptide repeat protein